MLAIAAVGKAEANYDDSYRSHQGGSNNILKIAFWLHSANAIHYEKERNAKREGDGCGSRAENRQNRSFNHPVPTEFDRTTHQSIFLANFIYFNIK